MGKENKLREVLLISDESSEDEYYSKVSEITWEEDIPVKDVQEGTVFGYVENIEYREGEGIFGELVILDEYLKYIKDVDTLACALTVDPEEYGNSEIVFAFPTQEPTDDEIVGNIRGVIEDG